MGSIRIDSILIGGYAGKILRIDLSRSKILFENLDYQLARRFIGGEGYAAAIMFGEVGPDTGPFDPENRLIFMTGPLTGSTVPCGNKLTVVSRSPLTGIWGEALFSASMGVDLKRAGFDGIVIQGRSESPVYVSINDAKVQINNAERLWGKDIFATFDAIREKSDNGTTMVCIGPAGEKLVKIACIVSDEGRVAGRTGMGAVAGSKNLKAIAVRGTGKIGVADESRLKKIREDAIKTALPNTKAFRDNGTAAGVLAFEKTGNLPLKNWTRGTFPEAAKIDGATMTQTILVKRKACFACPIACGRHVKVAGSPYAMEGPGPEYETMAALGSLCMNSNLESIAKANDICNRLGIDTLSAGGAIAFAMECHEHGLIADSAGVDLEWGNPDAIVKMVELIGKREGLGATLGEGVLSAAHIIGGGSERFAIHAKGLSFPMHNPRKFKSMGVAYATSNRGACHNRGSPFMNERGMLSPELPWNRSYDGLSTEEKGRMTKVYQDVCCAMDSVGVCKFFVFWGRVPLKFLSDSYSAVTGWDMSFDELLRAGERIWLTQRSFNVRMGATQEDDTLPKRFLEESVDEGPVRGQIVELEQMLGEYYRERGLDAVGKPRKEKLFELGLDSVASVLY
jgi:aldehyde:ferredoxin oxidoreductase